MTTSFIVIAASRDLRIKMLIGQAYRRCYESKNRHRAGRS